MPTDDARPTRDLTTRRNESTVPDEDIAALATSAAALQGERYELAEIIGLGGMGEVRACHDAHLAREVAMKLVRSDRDAPPLEARFFAEARVQGGLEHPGIVPVYDVGRDGQGRAYFTMKRVRGVGLDVVLARLGREEPDAMREYTKHRLLTAFAQVCLTVDFAHSRGVFHRDLKPSNVMLGDHGEVYVLDWGIAKVRPQASGDDAGPASAPVGAPTFVGTLGYVAPELAAGSRGNVLSDVFSLGAILFEIVASQPLLADDAAAQRFLGDPGSVERRPRLRASTIDVPAELDAICYRATSPEPSVRYPSARALHDAVEAFLGGDRDLSLRRKLAGEHLARASEMLKRALAGRIAPEEMADALRDAGRAVVLAPEDPRAVGVLVRLLTEPPEKLPPEVDEQVLQQSADRLQASIPSWAIVVLPLGWMTLYPALFLLGVRDWFQAVLVPVVWCLAGLVMFLDLKARRDPARGTWISVAAAMAAVASTTVLDGPLMVVPAMTVGVAMGATLRRKQHALPTVLGAAVLVGTALLAWSGVHDAYHFDDGAILPRFAQPVTPASLYLGSTAVHLLTLLVGTRFASRYRKALDEAETRAALFSWRLAKLLPRQVPRTVGSMPPPRNSVP
ncbi:MAG TPA: serine/threonine-protein kinase [Polyangiaceae bacterium]